MSTISSCKSIENKCDVYRGKDCMKKFCEPLRKHAMKIINFKKTNKNYMKMQKFVIFVKKNSKIKNIVKLEIIVIIQGNIEVLRIAYVI